MIDLNGEHSNKKSLKLLTKSLKWRIVEKKKEEGYGGVNDRGGRGGGEDDDDI